MSSKQLQEVGLNCKRSFKKASVIKGQKIAIQNEVFLLFFSYLSSSLPSFIFSPILLPTPLLFFASSFLLYSTKYSYFAYLPDDKD